LLDLEEIVRQIKNSGSTLTRESQEVRIHPLPITLADTTRY